MNASEDWKTFFLRHKWIPTSFLKAHFGIQAHDVNNFIRKPGVRQLITPWRISLNQSPESLRRIFTDAWRFYLVEISKVNFDTMATDWIPRLLSLRNLSREPNGLGFLASSKYYEIMCPDALDMYRNHGFTNIALGTHLFWPGIEYLRQFSVLPYMFHQTRKSVLDFINIDDMIEHVYLSFIAPPESNNPDFAKEVFLARFNEPGFLAADTLASFGVPYNFYAGQGGLRKVLARIADKYCYDLGLTDSTDKTWSSSKFRTLYPSMNVNRCRYCGVTPVDLHHLLPRHQYPELTFHKENVVPLCIQIHGLITRNHLDESQTKHYSDAVKRWHNAKSGEKIQVFDEVMTELHQHVYIEHETA